MKLKLSVLRAYLVILESYTDKLAFIICISYRIDLFRNSFKLRKSQKYKKIYLVDDYSHETQEKLKEMRAVSAFAKSQGIDSRLKETNLVIDGKTYPYKDMGGLPHNLSIEAAKVVEVEDGVAFQSKHAFLSSHYPYKITKDDRDYNCAEQILNYTRAVDNEQGGVAQQVLQENDPREIMKL